MPAPGYDPPRENDQVELIIFPESTRRDGVNRGEIRGTSERKAESRGSGRKKAKKNLSGDNGMWT